MDEREEKERELGFRQEKERKETFQAFYIYYQTKKETKLIKEKSKYTY